MHHLEYGFETNLVIVRYTRICGAGNSFVFDQEIDLRDRYIINLCKSEYIFGHCYIIH
jgi:hypothetical protein